MPSLLGLRRQTLRSKLVRSLMRLHLQHMAAALSCAVFIRMAIQNIGDSADTEATEDWSDRRHVAQLGAMWLGDKLKTAVVYSFEMPGQLANADGSRDVRRKNTHALHLIGSWHFGRQAGARHRRHPLCKPQRVAYWRCARSLCVCGRRPYRQQSGGP